eukprot:TRINITY_DN33453_c0_g1_i1.p1 TRINITY_DN33453_c0_g1~~TRINITY_DN33453_c0_g1_i1.p1  ORF type:complete len:326 (-),score=41.29 TRINITY_DN33453_c0_g1_i1:39-1016(-)
MAAAPLSQTVGSWRQLLFHCRVTRQIASCPRGCCRRLGSMRVAVALPCRELSCRGHVTAQLQSPTWSPRCWESYPGASCHHVGGVIATVAARGGASSLPPSASVALLLSSGGERRQEEDPKPHSGEESGETREPEEPQQRQPRQLRHSEITAAAAAQVATLLLRHPVWQVALHFVSIQFPLAWNWREFRSGSAEAVRAVHGLLGERDFESLHGLLTRSLHKDLQISCEATAAEEKWARPPKLKELRPLGIFYANALAGPQGDGAVVYVEPIMLLVEEYTFSDKSETVLVHRLQKWTFKERLSREGNRNGWQISSIDGCWYWRRQI